MRACDVMSRDVGVVERGASLAELERALAQAGVSGMPVVEGGIVVGVVSRADVLRELGGARGEGPRLSPYYADIDAFEAEELLQTFRDVASAAGAAPETRRVEEFMSRAVYAVSPATPVVDVARTMADHAIHRVLVVEDGRLVGVVSALDLVRRIADGTLGRG